MADVSPANVWNDGGQSDEDMKDTEDHAQAFNLYLKCQDSSLKDFKQA